MFHLGNVQATVTDKPVQQWSGGTWTHNMPALASAYDYYPFGMLMPGRYVSDTSVHCMTISTTQWVTTTFFMEVFCGDCPGINIIPSGGTQYQLQLQDGGFDMSMPIGSSATMDFTVEPGMDNRFEFKIRQITNNALVRFAITEDSMGMPKEIASELITKMGDYGIDFKPTGNTITLHISNEHPSRTAAFGVTGVAKIGTTTVQETILVEVCDEDKDRYRFGFNGQEKVNEWAGIGNSLDFDARVYDSRASRFLSLDPLSKKFPSESNYLFAGNNPMLFVDNKGEKKTIYYYTIDMRKPGLITVTPTKTEVTWGLHKVHRWDYNGLDSYDWYDYSENQVTLIDKNGKSRVLTSDPFEIDYTNPRTNTLAPSESYARTKVYEYDWMNPGKEKATGTKDNTRARDGSKVTGIIFFSKSADGSYNKFNADGRSDSKARSIDDLLSVFGVAGTASGANPAGPVEVAKYLSDGVEVSKGLYDDLKPEGKGENIDFCKDCNRYIKNGEPTSDTPSSGQKVDTIDVTKHEQ